MTGANETTAAKRIIGVILKQQWFGRKNDTALPCGDESFDATDAILLMPLSEINELEDGSEGTDDIGRDHVQWDGPCEVRITDSICEFFAVRDVEDITAEALVQARQEFNPQAAQMRTVTLTLKVKVNVQSGARLKDFIEKPDFGVRSSIPGVVVKDTEIVVCE